MFCWLLSSLKDVAQSSNASETIDQTRLIFHFKVLHTISIKKHININELKGAEHMECVQNVQTLLEPSYRPM